MEHKTLPKPHIEPSSMGPLLEELLNQDPLSLPILRQSCIQVLNLTADQRSNASDVGEVIMRDQALMANIIKIANSPAYHTLTSVKTPTHAVAIIGFDVIRSMVVAAQLVEQAEEYGANTECLKRLLARSLVAATEATEMGKAINYPDMGFLFTNAMLYTLGDLILAYCRPDIAEKLESERAMNPENVAKVELELLGRPLRTIAATVAKSWRLPESLIRLLEKKPILPNQRYRGKQNILEGLVHTANELSRCLLSPSSPQQQSMFRDLTSKNTVALGLQYRTWESLTIKAFTKASQYSDIVKIHSSYFFPKVDTENSKTHSPIHELTKAIRKAATLQNQERPRRLADPSPPLEVSTTSESPSKTDAPSNNQTPSPEDFIQQFALTALQIQEPNQLLNSAAEGLYTACGFQRVILMLVAPATGTLEVRICHGANIDTLSPLFRCAVKDIHFWTHILRQYQPLKLDSLQPQVESGQLSSDFIQTWGNGPCLVGPLFSPANPIGILIADRGQNEDVSLTTNDFATFALSPLTNKYKPC